MGFQDVIVRDNLDQFVYPCSLVKDHTPHIKSLASNIKSLNLCIKSLATSRCI